MGIRSAAVPGDHFPCEVFCKSCRSGGAGHGRFPRESLLKRAWDDDPEPPSLNIIRSYLSKGFGERLESREAAELRSGQKCFLAPLGTMTATKRSGKRKHRIIHDLKWNGVNDVVTSEERAVLFKRYRPRGRSRNLG